MSHLDLAHYALSAMRHRELRSWLTVLGIVVGIAAIVALISVGQGVQSYINGQLSSLGSDFITISAGSPKSAGGMGMGSFMAATSTALTTNDADAIRGVGGVKAVHTVVALRGDLSYRGDNITTSVVGADPGIFDDFGAMFKVREGRVLSTSDSHTVVIGNQIADDSFKTKITVGRPIELGNTTYRVVGIFDTSSGSVFSTGSMVVMTAADARAFMGNSRPPNAVDMILVKTQPGANPDDVANELTLRLRNVRHVNEDNQDFRVSTASSFMSRINTITAVVSLFLGGIAAIAIIVGGIGIANTMFMSVTERTREIGVMKAVGAKERDIMEVFLIESGLLGLIGGVVGIIIGSGLSIALNSLGVPALLTPQLLLFALVFSIVSGMLSGLFPARLAARLEPVTALSAE